MTKHVFLSVIYKSNKIPQNSLFFPNKRRIKIVSNCYFLN